MTTVTIDSLDGAIRSKRRENESIPTCQPKEVPRSALHEFFAGGIAGSAGVLVGHPFDTIKVRLQVSSQNSISMHGLFRGVGPPLFSATFINALVFFTYGESRRILEQDEVPKGEHNKWIDSLRSLLSGSIAGFSSSLVTCPVDNIKCQQQVKPFSLTTWDSALDLYRHQGVKNGLYRGFNSTCLRQMPSFAIYFYFYDMVKNQLDRYPTFANYPLLSSSVAGGITGSISWAAIYPIDVVKSRIQTLPVASPTMSIRDCFSTIIKEAGFSGLYRGSR